MTDVAVDGIGPAEAPAPQPEPVESPVVDTVTSLQGYMALVSQLSNAGPKLWFRGTRKASYDLVPSLYRHPSVTEANELIELEWALLSDFRHRAPPFSDRLPTEHLELLFLMQHFGVPTRLLDWTESPFVALFFALENAREAGAPDHDAAVWILDPVALNSLAADQREGSNQIYGAYAPELEAYKPRSEGKNLKERLPSAMFGIHNSPRIVAQRGAFVLFGKDTNPMNRHPKLNGPEGLVRRINVAAANKTAMFSELVGMGIADSVIYPDLDGLGREIRNYRGF